MDKVKAVIESLKAAIAALEAEVVAVEHEVRDSVEKLLGVAPAPKVDVPKADADPVVEQVPEEPPVVDPQA